jgi:biopolymer transport protein ExbB
VVRVSWPRPYGERRRVCAPARLDAQIELELVFKQEQSVLRRFRRPVRVLAAVAPLLGLLGTVVGMIETFAALTDRQLFAQSGGVAGGISMALLTTQLGLLVAIPGLFAGRLLDRRETRLRGELKRLDHLLQLHLAEREVVR